MEWLWVGIALANDATGIGVSHDIVDLKNLWFLQNYFLCSFVWPIPQRVSPSKSSL